MSDLRIIAEAAQGYEGSVDIARLLVRAAAAGGADAVKFQVVFLSDLAEPGYVYADLFRQLEMSEAEWRQVRDAAEEAGLAFLVDVFGPRSASLARSLGVDGVKLHTTTFFDVGLFDDVVSWAPMLLLSMGGIHLEEMQELLGRADGLEGRTTLLYGFQSEPTPLDRNNLLRMAPLRDQLGLDIGFMDHTDASGPDTVLVSAMALALGATVFEKHVGLDPELGLEDNVSALAPSRFAEYVAALRRLEPVLGAADVALTEDELAYRGKALKRVVAARPLEAGTIVGPGDIRLSRPAVAAGAFRPDDVVGGRLVRSVAEGAPLSEEEVERP